MGFTDFLMTCALESLGKENVEIMISWIVSKGLFIQTMRIVLIFIMGFKTCVSKISAFYHNSINGKQYFKCGTRTEEIVLIKTVQNRVHGFSIVLRTLYSAKTCYCRICIIFFFNKNSIHLHCIGDTAEMPKNLGKEKNKTSFVYLLTYLRIWLNWSFKKHFNWSAIFSFFNLTFHMSS